VHEGNNDFVERMRNIVFTYGVVKEVEERVKKKNS